MNKSIKEILIEKNIFWKILSLIMAIGLWFVVINTQNPEETRTFTVNTQVVNYESVTDAGLTAVNLDEIKAGRVVVKVRGPRLTLDRLGTNPGITAKIDMSKLDLSLAPGTVSCNIDVSLSNPADSVQIDSASKHTVQVVLEALISKSMPVDIITNGNSADGFNIVAESISPSEVTVSGAATDVNRVVSVRGIVDITAMEADRDTETDIFAYDADGSIVENVILSSSKAKVSLKAHVSMRVPINVNIEGEPRSGHTVDSIVCAPMALYITGRPEILDTIESIELPAIDITDRVGAVQSQFYLENILPEGITAADGIERIVVDIYIATETTDGVEIPGRDITVTGKDEGFEYEIVDESVNIPVKGSSTVVAAAEGGNIKVSVDVSGLAEGEHRLIPSVELPEGLSLGDGLDYVRVIVRNASDGE